MWHNTLYRNLSSIFTSTLYHQLPTLQCSDTTIQQVVCACANANGSNFKPVTIGHTHHSRHAGKTAAVLRVYVRWRCSRSARMSILSDYRNRYDREQATSPRLVWPEALCTSALGVHFRDHHVCAHGPTVLSLAREPAPSQERVWSTSPCELLPRFSWRVNHK